MLSCRKPLPAPVSLEQVLMPPGEFFLAFANFDPELETHRAGVLKLYEHLRQSDPCLLAANAEWIELLAGRCRTGAAS